MQDHPLLILGSARKSGDTHRLADLLLKDVEVVKADLLDYTLYPYSYSGYYPPDDEFPKLIKLLIQHKRVVFATPVYWYAMSGLMKTFFDRLTDIVTINKKLGRQMKGKETFLIAVGAEELLPTGFEEPFRLTSDYLEMDYKGSYYCSERELNIVPNSAEFLKLLS